MSKRETETEKETERGWVQKHIRSLKWWIGITICCLMRYPLFFHPQLFFFSDIWNEILSMFYYFMQLDKKHRDYRFGLMNLIFNTISMLGGGNNQSAGLRNRSKRVRTPVVLLRSLSGKYPFGKIWIPLSSQLWVELYYSCSFWRMILALNNLRRLIKTN